MQKVHNKEAQKKILVSQTSYMTVEGYKILFLQSQDHGRWQSTTVREGCVKKSFHLSVRHGLLMRLRSNEGFESQRMSGDVLRDRYPRSDCLSDSGLGFGVRWYSK
jgi:hypothetical protein